MLAFNLGVEGVKTRVYNHAVSSLCVSGRKDEQLEQASSKEWGHSMRLDALLQDPSLEHRSYHLTPCAHLAEAWPV